MCKQVVIFNKNCFYLESQLMILYKIVLGSSLNLYCLLLSIISNFYIGPRLLDVILKCNKLFFYWFSMIGEIGEKQYQSGIGTVERLRKKISILSQGLSLVTNKVSKLFFQHKKKSFSKAHYFPNSIKAIRDCKVIISWVYQTTYLNASQGNQHRMQLAQVKHNQRLMFYLGHTP